MIVQLNALRFVAFDINFQGISRTLKHQIIKSDAFSENDFVRSV